MTATGKVTTHVLDTAQGRPAAGVVIDVWYRGMVAEGQQLIKQVTTNSEGRTDEPLLADDEINPGEYELTFAVGDYFAHQPVAVSDPPFLKHVPIRFTVADIHAHYHVPLLVSPWAYSTYRGS